MESKSPAHFIELIQKGAIEEARRALAEDASLAQARSEGGLSALVLATYYGQAELARLIAGLRHDLTLPEAVIVGDLERVQLLAEADPALVNAFTSDGFQPLGFAAFFNQPGAAAILLERGAEVNTPSRNAQQVPPLNSAAAGGALEIARMLLERGADPNGRQAGEFRPLHNAAQNGQVELIELLLEHGADPNLRAAGGETALDFALQAGQREADELLKARGAAE